MEQQLCKLDAGLCTSKWVGARVAGLGRTAASCGPGSSTNYYTRNATRSIEQISSLLFLTMEPTFHGNLLNVAGLP